MRLYTLISTLFVVVLLVSCQNNPKALGVLKSDGLCLSVNSAGIGYDVVDNNKLDSSRGLTYIVALSVTNTGNMPLSFTDSSFSLFDANDQKMPSTVDSKTVDGAINVAAFTTTVEPGKTEEVLLMYSVKEHGAYRFQFISPINGKHTTATLPAS
jgi:hypothetical protein